MKEEIEVRKDGLVFSGEMANQYNISEIFIRSGYFTDITKVSQAMVKIQAGKELGLEPFTAMQGLYIVKGKIMIAGNTIAGKIKAHPRYDYNIIHSGVDYCEIEFFENQVSVGTSKFTYEKAQKIGLTKNSVWQDYTQTMLFNRAVSQGYKIFCPDIFNYTVYTDADDNIGEEEPTTVNEAIQKELSEAIETAEVEEQNIVSEVAEEIVEVAEIEIEDDVPFEKEVEEVVEVPKPIEVQRQSDNTDEAKVRADAMADMKRLQEQRDRVANSVKRPAAKPISIKPEGV